MAKNDEKNELGKYAANEYFTKRLGKDKVLVTTRHGSWVMLDDEEYGLLYTGRQDEKDGLAGKLERNGIVITNRNVKSIMECYATMYKMVAPEHVLCIINVTRRCPLKCRYCFVAADDMSGFGGWDLDFEAGKKIVDFIASMPQKRVSIEFQGGEPTANFEVIKQIYEYSVKKILESGKSIRSFAMVTNLTLMNEDIAEFVIRNNIGLCTSLDGPKELHDRHRMFYDESGSYEHVVKWIKYFKGRGKKVNLLSTMTGLSIRLGARAIIDEHLRLGGNVVNFRPMYFMGRGKGDDELYFSADEFVDFWISGIEYMAELTHGGQLVYDDYSRSLIRAILSPIRGFMCSRRPCGAGTSQLSFAADGSIYSCDMNKGNDEFRLGNVGKDRYEEVYMNAIPFFTNLPDFQPLCDTCAYAAYCPSCPGKAFAQHGRIGAVTPRDFQCKIYKRILDYLFLKFSDPSYRKVFEMWAADVRC